MGEHQTATQRTVSTEHSTGSTSHPWRSTSESTLAVVLWTTAVLASGLDVVTTVVGLSRGLREGNAFARGLLETFGTPGLVGLKLAALLALAATVAALDERRAYAALAGFGTVTVAVVALNLVTLATV